MTISLEFILFLYISRSGKRNKKKVEKPPKSTKSSSFSLLCLLGFLCVIIIKNIFVVHFVMMSLENPFLR